MTLPANSEQPEEGVGPSLHRFINVDAAPEFYADALNVNTGLYGVSIHFGTRSVSDIGSHTKLHGVLRLSPQLAKVLTAILMKQIRAYETDIGKIPLLPGVVDATGIGPEVARLESRDGQ